MTDKGSKANIKVAVRCRPPLENEARQTFEKLMLNSTEKAVSAWNERTNSYKTAEFDIVLDQDASQGKVFEQTGMNDIVKHVADGYHATVFAYGQTGSGKTFTMEGYKYRSMEQGKAPSALFECGENEGIVPRSIRLLFDIIRQQSNLQKKKFTVYCSYLQVYKEKIYDLLNKSHVKGVVADGPGLKLKWNKNDIFSVENLFTFECKTVDDVMALYHFGIKNKVVASHNMNNSSSRSHSMLSLTVEQVEISNLDNIVVSKLQLVDLAGSERQSQTGNVANKESIDINKSLFTLRQVITALTDKQRNNSSNQYVPYRDSKLTCLLRQSLGGNSYCLMVACLNPCDEQIDENISTMQYASQASYISNKPVRNDDPKARQIEALKEQIKNLTEELTLANQTIILLQNAAQNNVCMKCLNGEGPEQKKNQLPPSGQINSDNKFRPDSAVTEKRNLRQTDSQRRNRESSRNSRGSRESSLVEHRQIITQRIIKDQEKVDKFFKEKADQLKNIASYQKQQNPLQPHSAANESKDAITERIVHTVNMMKEVLQGNLSLRENIQRQSEQLDDCNAEIFQLSQENEDLRERLAIYEESSGKNSLAEIQVLRRDKKRLEDKIKQIEQGSQNFTQTRENFNKKMNQQMMRSSHLQKLNSQIDGIKRATLTDQFNDDFEPVRPVMQDNDDEFAYYDEVDRSMHSNKHIKTTPSHSKMAYDQVSGQKVFRVTTTNKQRALNNIMSKQRQGAIIAQVPKKNSRVPLPNANNIMQSNRTQMPKASSQKPSKNYRATTQQQNINNSEFTRKNLQSNTIYNSQMNKQAIQSTQKELNQTIMNVQSQGNLEILNQSSQLKSFSQVKDRNNSLEIMDEPQRPFFSPSTDQNQVTSPSDGNSIQQHQRPSKLNQTNRPPKSPNKYGNPLLAVSKNYVPDQNSGEESYYDEEIDQQQNN